MVVNAQSQGLTQLITSILLLLATPGSSAGECESYGEADAQIGQFYLDIDRDSSVGEPSGLAVYEESNGIPGLQRHDPSFDGTCNGAIPSDNLILLSRRP